jgi:hypothetical protein
VRHDACHSSSNADGVAVVEILWDCAQWTEGSSGPGAEKALEILPTV